VALVAAVTTTPVAVFLASTGAFGTTDADESEITPVIVPPVCPNAAQAQEKTAIATIADLMCTP